MHRPHLRPGCDYRRAVRPPVTLDLFAEVAQQALEADDPLAAASRLTAWAEDPHPDDEVSTRELLSTAGTLQGAGGDVDGGVALLHRAIATDGPAETDPRGGLYGLLLRAGRQEEADRLAQELRRERPTPAEALGDVALSLWEHGRLEDAHRWYTLAASRVLRDTETDPGSPGVDALPGLLADRAELRAELDLPADELDELGGQLDLEDHDHEDLDDVGGLDPRT